MDQSLSSPLRMSSVVLCFEIGHAVAALQQLHSAKFLELSAKFCTSPQDSTDRRPIWLHSSRGPHQMRNAFVGDGNTAASQLVYASR
ncbi:hypothetical protein K474DRAFT_733064 [Panus rudis PR-1116 ss-1]|nr:hypothetical protein K474DRAFT_733064 [Panus rudis PR-1116 ss-1]